MERCTDEDTREQVRSGFAVLLSSGKALRRGYTTGATAAAACKAAILSLEKEVDAVDITVPCGLVVRIDARGRAGQASCRKFAGDYRSDVTAGIEIRARYLGPAIECSLEAGEGIGRIDRDTPRKRKGQASISESASKLIMKEMQEACAAMGSEGARVELSIPEGEKVAQRTLNPKLGIKGGISVLGTTGLVEPWDDHLGESAVERVRSAERVVLTTGRIGLRHARLLFPEHEVVLVGVNIAEAMKAAKGELVLCGLPALILKFIDPEVLEGTGSRTVEELMATDQAEKVLDKCFQRFKRDHPGARLVIVDREGEIMRDSG